MDTGHVSQSVGEVIRSQLDLQRRAYLEEGSVSLKVRRDRLNRVLDSLMVYEREFIEAVSNDFAHRSKETTLFADIYPSVAALKGAIKHVSRWMRPEKRSLMFPLGLLGAKARIELQPKGVVGLITPWNFPLTMVYVPLSQMVAAGNRVMIKPSEHTPRTSALFKKVFSESFDASEICVVEGGVDVSKAFAAQPFDHLMFTGSPMIGKEVMRAASEHLVPVTLELGGKSPVVIGVSADLDSAAERIATMKLLNAGQICLAPDYVLIDEARRDKFIELYKSKIEKMYPKLLANDDYTSIISQVHLKRLEGYLTEARDRGVTVETVNPSKEDFSGQTETRKMAPAVVVEPTGDLGLMREEIFGPILPVKTYSNMEGAVGYINERHRPLALYYFGRDTSEEAFVLSHTTSGGVTVNDCLFHGGHETLPLCGIGNSGMGRYHGIDGFREFSHMKPVLKHPRLSLSKLLGIIPPYTDRLRKNVDREMGR